MSHIFVCNYPAGAEHDPRAPWNQKDDECETCNGAEVIECPECHDCDGSECKECDDTGKVECPDCGKERESEAERRACYLEYKADCERDERGME